MSKLQELSRLRSAFCSLSKIFSLHPFSLDLITGCPRSGTRALLGWLESHEKVIGFNELRILVASSYFWEHVKRNRELDCDNALLAQMLKSLIYEYYGNKKLLWRKHVIAKIPLEPIGLPDEQYQKFLQNVREVFPNMKILCIIREPVSTIWSMKNRTWGRSLTSGETYRFDLKTCIEIWKVNANLIAEYIEKPYVYVCKFENFINTPVEETQKIEAFLDLRDHQPFFPKPTQNIGFTEPEKMEILEETARERKIFEY